MTQLPLFDTSALLAFIYEEPGSDNVELHLSDGGMISAVNWSELGQKILHHNLGWANISQQLKAVMREHGLLELAPDQIEALEMIAHKIARILNGNPDTHDHWHDIAGYATLVANRLTDNIERK